MAPTAAVILSGAASALPDLPDMPGMPDPPGMPDLPGPAGGDRTAPVLIAADGGLAAAAAAGRRADHLVGDLDSADPDLVGAARAAGTVVHRFPADKDATDLELALELAVGLGVTVVTVVSGHGSRFDHLVAETMLLASPRWAALVLDAWYPPAHVVVARAGATTAVDARPGSLISLVPAHGPATVSTTGLSWPLDAGTLEAGSSRGVSNVAGGPVTVTVHAGTVLVIRPFALEEQQP